MTHSGMQPWGVLEWMLERDFQELNVGSDAAVVVIISLKSLSLHHLNVSEKEYIKFPGKEDPSPENTGKKTEQPEA
ncbi:hypothetical protein NQZ68_018735 [Dissostichus eleginoides]|nr:hypothetical protein NQZ68_018735 [Dissostichus eleginoides]